FTLVEVLVALALLSTLVVGVVTLTGLSTKASATLRLKASAGAILTKTMEATLAVRASNFGSLTEGTFHPEVVGGKWALTPGKETVDGVERWVEISRVQREVSCGGERVCPIVDSGGVVDPVTFRGKAFVSWSELGEVRQESLESLLTFWR
ncbi:TPA: hypothetical protein DEB02_00075, partial [Candidatus Beckwithbacteria bacterium]|nr:hypothetical protein [Candidatus Beckwithbacteria bacterium]